MDKLSPETRHAIDMEVKRLLDDSYSRAKQLLVNRRDELEVLAKGLIQYETLSAREIKGECANDWHFRENSHLY